MVVTNHPLASAAGSEMLCAGGNAVDAAVAALFTLSVVEPMMVGLLGGGFAHLRHSDGTHTILEGQGTCPQAVGPHTFTHDALAPAGSLESVGRQHTRWRFDACRNQHPFSSHKLDIFNFYNSTFIHLLEKGIA